MKFASALTFLLVVLPSVAESQTELRLIPQPREVQVEGSVPVRAITIARPANSDDAFAATDLANAFRERGLSVSTAEAGPGPRVVLLRLDGPSARAVLLRHSLTFDPAMRDEGYVITPDG